MLKRYAESTSGAALPNEAFRATITPFHVFPEEVWLEIINTTTDSVLQNLFRASPEFSLCFQKQIKISQFTKVSDWNYDLQSCDTELQLNDLFSKHWWSKDMQQRVENMSADLFYVTKRTKTSLETVSFQNVNELQNFIPSEYLRSVRLFSFDKNVSNTFLTACADFLSKHGKSVVKLILDLSITVYCNMDEAQTALQLILQCLSNLPNLETICTDFGGPNRCRFLKHCINSCENFPVLPKLAHLELPEPNKGTATMTLMFFLNGYISKGQIKYLTIISGQTSFSSTEEYELDFKSHQISNLYKFREYIASSNLKSLTVKQVYNNFFPQSMRWVRARHFSPVEIHIENDSDAKLTNFKNIPVLSSVKYLKLTFSPNVEFEMLRAFTSLQHLCIYFDKKNHAYRPTITLYTRQLNNLIIKCLFDDYFNQPETLWTELPSLQSLAIVSNESCTFYSRTLKNIPVVLRRSSVNTS